MKLHFWHLDTRVQTWIQTLDSAHSYGCGQAQLGMPKVNPITNLQHIKTEFDIMLIFCIWVDIHRINKLIQSIAKKYYLNKCLWTALDALLLWMTGFYLHKIYFLKNVFLSCIHMLKPCLNLFCFEVLYTWFIKCVC